MPVIHMLSRTRPMAITSSVVSWSSSSCVKGLPTTLRKDAEEKKINVAFGKKITRVVNRGSLSWSDHGAVHAYEWSSYGALSPISRRSQRLAFAGAQQIWLSETTL